MLDPRGECWEVRFTSSRAETTDALSERCRFAWLVAALHASDCRLHGSTYQPSALTATCLHSAPLPRQVAGLYCADGSCFPTPTGLNPMIT